MAKNQRIEALLELHRVDSEIHKLESQQELLPVSLRRIETRLARQLEAIEERKARIRSLRAGSHSKEVELRSEEEVLERLNAQLRKVRTNKEYAAIQHELSSKKVDSSRVEDEILALMADVEAAEGELKELQQSVAQIGREQTKESKLVEEEIAQIDERLAKLRKRRTAAADSVDGELLQEYERIAARKGATAIAAVVGHTCQGCFMQMPPQLDHDLRSGTKLVHCPSCSRILYIP
jgi:predicted  nucleic acid-binding Zn-ribbon protein